VPRRHTDGALDQGDHGDADPGLIPAGPPPARITRDAMISIATDPR
jgi:hypothetical protein